MKIAFSYLLLSVCLSCCNAPDNTTEKKIVVSDSTIIGGTVKPAIKKDSINYVVIDSAVHISLDRENSAKTISGKLRGNNQPIKIYIDINSGDTLHVLIEPTERDANIRL